MGDQIVVFNDGKIQQSGKGKELYFKPANVFVAKFIGSPTMNTFVLVYNDGFIYDESGKINIKLDKETAEKLYNNQKLIIGFRSEDLRISYTNVDNSALGKISSIELIGKDQLVLVKLNDKTEFIVNATNSDEFELFTYDMLNLLSQEFIFLIKKQKIELTKL